MRSLLLPALLWATLTVPAWAQSIIPAADGTGTLVMPDGSTYQITGGTLSGDGANLFHSFEQFGLTAAEVANFLADPTVQNILGRVVGGNASVINGLLQVSGSSANLYLLNPAGILFGPNSALNLDGSFTATTASGLGFGENWLPALGDTNYAALTGNPTAFAFGSEPGALINAGNLAVKPGEVITLASGSVINLGTLTAPGGQILVVAVPGENRVSIRPEGAILGLELATLPEEVSPLAPLPFSPLDIPSLLRAGQPEVATGITTNPDGTVSLTGSAATLPTTSGTTLVSGTLDVAGETGGEVQVLGDRIALTAATIDASGTQGGGQILIGGEYQGGGTTPTSDRTYVDANSTLTADALESGNGGEVIVWADETNRFYGQISAQGGASSGDGGFAEVSGRDYLDFAGTIDLSAPQGLTGTLLLDPTNIEVIAGTNNPAELAANDEFADPGVNSTITNGTINAATANVVLQATNDITVNAPVSIAAPTVGFTATAGNNIAINSSLATNGGNIALNGDQNLDGVGSVLLNTGSSLSSNGGSITATGRSDDPSSGQPGISVKGPINSAGGSITLTGVNSNGEDGILVQNSIASGGGDIQLTGACTGPVCGGAEGIILFGGSISSDGGAITLQGSSSTTDEGIQLIVGGSINAGAGPLTLITDRLNLVDVGGGVLQGSGSLVLQPLNPSIALTLGGAGDAAATFLNADELARLTDGFSSITIGSSTGTGAITLDSNVTFSDPTILQTLGSIDTTTGSVLSGIDDASLSLLAGSGVNIGENGEISTAGRSVVIEGDRDGNGSVTVAQPITTGGGDITITGASATDRAIFIDSQGDINSQGGDISLIGTSTGTLEGINLQGAVNSQGGAISLTGNSANGEGVVLLPFSSISSGSGDISITGISAGTSTESEGVYVNALINSVGGNISITGTSANDQGILINDEFPNITSGGGAINLTGTSTGGDGITLSFVEGSVDSGGGDITMTGTGATAGITVFNSVTVTAGTGQFILNTDSPNILGMISGSGSLQIQPRTTSLPITLGSTDNPATTFLNQGELAQLTNVFRGITIGSNSGTGAITLAGDITLTNPTTLLTQGNINTTAGDITTFGNPITLQAGGSIAIGNLNSSGINGGAVRLQAGDSIQVNSINAQGTTSGGTITALTPSTFQVVGSFTDQNGVAASLSTVGGSRGGEILLGYGASTFTLGDPSFNGTLAAITTGDVTLLPDVANPILGSRIFGRGLAGQVQFISFGDIPVEIEPPPDEIDPVPDPQRDLETIEENAPVFLTSAGDVLGQEQLSEAEDSVNGDFAGYFGDLIKSPRSVNLQQARATLRDIAAQTGEVPAFMYVRLNRDAKPGEGGVELLLITAEGEPSQVRVLNTTAEEVLKTQEQLRRQLTNPSLTDNTAYLTSAQQLYGWLIAPIEAELKAVGVTNIGFVMDAGLRTLPLAALHNGERFLIEDYSLGLIPSLGLIDPTYVDLNRQNSTLLVSGASQFINLPPLLAAEVEMQTLQTLWPGTKVAETRFTVSNLQRDRRQAQIIHMATHAQFLRGAPDNSYLQFFDSRLRLNQVPELGWFDPQVELVTLSACQTAMGNADAELGFAGFALLAGAKSALASLWKVNDEATAGLMITFYQTLDQEAIKAEALREAQLAMVRGQVYTENGQLIWPSGSLALPPDLVIDGRQDLSHPFYWAAFTMVGSPW